MTTEGVVARRYRVLRRLGAGGMGEVFEVEHIEFGKRFALKKLTSASAAHPDSLKRFRREARAASAVGHPGIVDVIDFGTDEDGSAFMVMELLTGESLRARLDRLGRLDEHEALDIGRELLVCLAAAHDAGVLHRDLKPENTFLQEPPRLPRVKLLDFGIAKAAGLDAPLTMETHAAMGTPPYMAPELLRDGAASRASDIYAWGVLMFECITGRAPFTAKTIGTLVTEILTKPAPVEALEGRCSPRLRQGIAACLDKDPACRPAGAAVLAQALGADLIATPAGSLDPALANTMRARGRSSTART